MNRTKTHGIKTMDNEDTLKQTDKKENLPSSLLNQGGYGCVYYPAVKCLEDSSLDQKKYVSKLQVLNKSAINEVKISKIIKNIIGFDNFFAPIVNICDIDLKKFDNTQTDEHGETCGIINRKAHRQFALLHIPYIHDGNFNKNIIKFGVRKTFIGLIDCYNHLLNGLRHLADIDILHYDLKNDNILYNSVKQQPIIIDFGLSINLKPILPLFAKKNVTLSHRDIKLLRDKFYVFAPDYYLWCLEIHIISFFFNGSKYDFEEQSSTVRYGDSGGGRKITHELKYNTLTYEYIKQICKMYIAKNKTLRVFNRKFRLDYLKNSIKYFSKYIGMKPELVIKDLLVNWKTWDNYSVSIMYIKIINSVFDFKQNKTIDFFYELLLQNMHYDPNKRLSINDTWHKFKEVFYSGDSIENLLILLNTHNLDKEAISKKLDQDVEHINTIIEAALRKKIT